MTDTHTSPVTVARLIATAMTFAASLIALALFGMRIWIDSL